jgi:hypothetical protein
MQTSKGQSSVLVNRRTFILGVHLLHLRELFESLRVIRLLPEIRKSTERKRRRKAKASRILNGEAIIKANQASPILDFG